MATILNNVVGTSEAHESAVGMHTRDSCEPFNETWNSVRAHQRQRVHEPLKMVERDADNRYKHKDWKSRLHTNFKRKGGGKNLDRVKAESPHYLRDKSHWERCCMSFSSTSFQTNTQHEPQPAIQKWRDMHRHGEAWVNPQADETYHHLEERSTQMVAPGSDAASGSTYEKSDMHEVLGWRRRGHICRVGPTLPYASSLRPSDSTDIVSLQEHQEVVRRMDELTNAFTTLHDFVARLHPNSPLPGFGLASSPPSSSSSSSAPAIAPDTPYDDVPVDD